MIQQIQEKTGIQISEDGDMESIFSIEDEPSDQSLFAIQHLEDEQEDPTTEWSSEEGIYMLQSKISPKMASIVPIPHVQASIYLGKFEKPISIIAFIDTGAAETIMNLYVLPSEWWKPHVKYFNSAADQTFATHLIRSKEIISSTVKKLKIKACAESHEEFLSKCDHPLWKNPEFFIQMPFKNKDINPTKASHSGMNPDHQKLAETECNELLQQDLIEPSDSQWSCEAFYVNKRSEKARGKLRLMINYQPLNHFLKDDKFPLPNRNALFSSLAKAQIFSKFDLKAGFWQLGIDPVDRPKTGFCIPNHHY
ncbi:hypothetical protein V6N12_069922 [Hibiscus sabdariffa]|uniref:Polyprotein n=1 Tax=Hibiscus sabdariffa TaxID=183260 RepID=A0ABR2FFH9_9ROSI